MHSFWLLCSLAAGLALAPATKAKTKPRPAPGAAAVIRSAMAAEAAAWNRGDIDGFMAAYWKSPETEFIGSGGVTQGWATVREHYRQHYPTRAAMGTLTFSGLRVTLLGRNYAYVLGHFRLELEKDHPEGLFTLLWRKFPEGWRIISDHTTETGH
ncbi:MAG: YybH family protein [Terriglobales bacterium]